MAGSIKNIHTHAILEDKTKCLVICKYCGENTRSLNQLKIYLSGVHKCVSPCEEVTDIVRETYRDMLMKDKRGRKKNKSSRKSVSAENGNIDVVPCEQAIRETFEDRSGLTDAKRVGEVQGNSYKRARSEEGSSSKSVSAGNGNIGVEVKKRARSKDSDQFPEKASATSSTEEHVEEIDSDSIQSGWSAVEDDDKFKSYVDESLARHMQDGGASEAASEPEEMEETKEETDEMKTSLGVENNEDKIEFDHQFDYQESELDRSNVEEAESSCCLPKGEENIGAATYRVVEADEQDLLSNQAQKCIARFFYENCIDFSAVDSLSFKEMMIVGGGGGQMLLKFPDSEELKGRILQETLKEVQDHVKKIKDSWEVTGCSILLDSWVDQKSHDLVSFVADCPAGPVYLRSFDVSDIKNNVTELTSLVDGLVEEVGVRNVIQIISCSNSGWVGELGKSFVGDNRKFFWYVSISHCIQLMLLKIREMDNFGEVLDKVSNIWEFIKNNHGMIITVSFSEYEFARPYLTLESIFKAKRDLEAMFDASDWNNRDKGITISKLVKDSSFWETVERVMKSTSPLIHGLLRFSTANNQNVGYIYDTMVGIKKSIAKQFNGEKLSYKPIWDVIDDVWKQHLHSPLHAAGYFLNPAFFSLNRFPY